MAKKKTEATEMKPTCQFGGTRACRRKPKWSIEAEGVKTYACEHHLGFQVPDCGARVDLLT